MASLDGDYEVCDEGLRRVSPFVESLVRWNAVDRVSRTDSHLIIHFMRTGWIIPFRCFATPSDRDGFIRAVADRQNDSDDGK